MKTVVLVAALAASALAPTAAQAGTLPPPPQGTVIDCGYIQISPYVRLNNLTSRYLTRWPMCGVALNVAPRIYRASIHHNMRSFRWGAWWVSVRAVPFAGTVYYDERATASGGRVVRFQVYFE